MEQNSIKGIPYGLSDYESLTRDNCYYVDKTLHPPDRARSSLPLPHPPPPLRQDVAHQHAGRLL